MTNDPPVSNGSPVSAYWEPLLARETVVVRRRGRSIVAELLVAHRVMSTSPVNGGQSEHLRFLVNQQSCEGAGHPERHRLIAAGGPDADHVRACGDAGTPSEVTATMGTAANMHYAAIVTCADATVEVTAIVTAGVDGNATCAGDIADWRERADGLTKVPPYVGTINTIVLVNTPLTTAALARAVVTMTEGKSAALQRLAVPSRQSVEMATGTGTDQFCVAAPLTGTWTLTSASPHVKLGELIGRAVRDATCEALRWQNGLEPSYTRGLCHALARYGVKEATLLEDLGPHLAADDLALLRKNLKAMLYEPLVGASAHALAMVLDRVRHGAIPASVERDACIQQAATLAASVAGCPERWPELRARLHATSGDDPKVLVLSALALGWSEKWRAR